MKYFFNKYFKYLRVFKNIFLQIKFNCYTKPRILQLPITYMCNFDCVMCGVSKLKNKKDFTPEELRKIITSKLFRKITAVGINGGEPFIKDNLLNYIHAIVDTLPKLKNIHIITNGYFIDRIKEVLPQIKSVCALKRVSLNIAVSVDGIGEKNDFHRGKKCMEKIEETIDFLLSDLGKKCYDYMNIICTITKYNVYDLSEVEVWAEKKHLNIAYNIATYNERISNLEKYEDFTIFNDELARQITEEIFYQKFRETLSEKYFCLYWFVQNRQRIALCEYKCNFGVTLTPNNQLSYCATYSKELGNAFLCDAAKLFKQHIPYRKKMVREKCKTCSHYANVTSLYGSIIYLLTLLKTRKLFH